MGSSCKFTPSFCHIFISLINFSSAILNSISDKESPCFNPVLTGIFFDFIVSTLIFTYVSIILDFIRFISFCGKLNSTYILIRSSRCRFSFIFWKSTKKTCISLLYSHVFCKSYLTVNIWSVVNLPSLKPL